MKGKAIYSPTGKAGEYAKYACNFYTGCSNACDYCYCRKGVMAHTWSDKPHLKKCFESKFHAIFVFEQELKKNIKELKEHGLFFSFTTDPMLFEIYDLTMEAAKVCHSYGVPVTILTKCTWFLNDFLGSPKDFATIGFTLTGHDELESHASTNAKRIETMKALHEAGFKTWASIEPVITVTESLEMMKESQAYCGHFKIGLLAGKKYDNSELQVMYSYANNFTSVPVTFKESFLKQLGEPSWAKEVAQISESHAL
jgi:DNA repair photolyase